MSARTILTLANGRGIDLRFPQASDIDFAVMAEHLAKENRFNGATPGCIYSVAEHLVRGVDGILEETGDRTLAAYWSLHDGHESILKDDTTPKKRALAEEIEEQCGVLGSHILKCFEDIVDRHDRAIYTAAGLIWPCDPAIAAAVKHWDLRLFVTEWRDLMTGFDHPNWEYYRDIAPLPRRIKPYSHWQFPCDLLMAWWKKLLPVFNGARA